MSSLVSTPKPTIVSLVTPPETPALTPTTPYVPPVMPALPTPIAIPKPVVPTPIVTGVPTAPRIPKPSIDDRFGIPKAPPPPSLVVPVSSPLPAPSTPAPVTTPVPRPVTPDPVSTATVSDSTTPVDAPVSDTSPDHAVTDLLRRNRGRLGTILTSFRGILSANDLTPYRKTLLGE